MFSEMATKYEKICLASDDAKSEVALLPKGLKMVKIDLIIDML